MKRWVLLEAGSIAEPIEVGFDIDLAELKLRDTFDGVNLFLRHKIQYRIVRPWYTFSVRPRASAHPSSNTRRRYVQAGSLTARAPKASQRMHVHMFVGCGRRRAPMHRRPRLRG